MLRKKSLIILIITVVIYIVCTLYYLSKLLPSTENEVRIASKIRETIYKELETLPENYKTPPQWKVSSADVFLASIKDVMNLQLRDLDLAEIWQEADTWPSSKQITNITSPNISKVIYGLKHAKIINADVDTRGTQLKLLLTLYGNQQCVFKPQWYDIKHVVEGAVYAGKDRFGAELVAFYLSILLDKPLVPVVVIRTISLKYDILPVATQTLMNTSFNRDYKTCLYGKCFYCKREDPVCDNDQHLLTGSVILNIKRSFSNYRSPWQRTYKKTKQAPWETDINYCKHVKRKLHKKRLFDLIDTAIFDFLLQNGDRHHYETLEDMVVWLDNGKSLGNPYVQHVDILAPLYQCCLVRSKMWKGLLNLAGGNLAKYLMMMPDIESVMTVLHLRAMEERLLMVFAVIEYCKKQNLNRS